MRGFAIIVGSALLCATTTAAFAGSDFESSKLSPAVVMEGEGLQSSKVLPGIVTEGSGLQSSKLSPGVVLENSGLQSPKLSIGVVVEALQGGGGIVSRAPLTHW
ncbi:hypothetical protein ACFSOZ_23295 [Mesorhizobium newzealandense]|uniref:Secreted protein n=1 Tax=Mesorhizobium newzealandense TaxID=1300302 RepID=A0ABW4UE94_9HYPH